MTLGRKYKKKPQRTITTRSFKPNTDLLNKLTNSSELPHSTGMQSNMAVNSSSASNNHFHEIFSLSPQENYFYGFSARQGLTVGYNLLPNS